MLRCAAIGIVLFGLGCSSSTTGTDLGIVEPGCRAPSACFKVGTDCPCNRIDVATTSCRVCDPQAEVCVCEAEPTDMGQDLGARTVCLQAASVCIGRSPMLCPGVGARCLPVNTSCDTPVSGEPPQLISMGSGTGLEPHCAFVDDVCCPGAIVDLGSAD